jgi:Protein of unknown function (DUF2905)
MERNVTMGRILVIAGVLIVIVGLLWPWLPRLGLGRLPGDIYIQGERGSLYIPITTSILASVALSILFWLFSR